ncbi:MAG: methyltransferase domain-containing protein [Planctomycetes bacterium]|nr:methyltransferase domain-containing protein [Planctomycetota bacterium]
MREWQTFFDAYAPRYDAEVFTKNTDAEIEFILEHLRPSAGCRVLDVGCGTGRHSVALARRGFQVTGVDLSRGMLALAEQRAQTASVAVTVEWLHSDAAAFKSPNTFEIALCLCEGAMCLLGADDDPLERDVTILRNVYDALQPGGRFILNVLNAYRMIRAATDEGVAAGRFDVLNVTEISDAVELLPGADPAHRLRERGYTPPEIRRMLAAVGFELTGVYGGTAGDWGLRPPTLDEFELMVLAHKPAGDGSDQ